MSTAHDISKLVLVIALAMLLAVTVPPALSRPQPPDSAGNVVTKLWDSAADGELLSVEGWKNTSGFFVHPGPPPEANSFLVVSNDWVVGPVIVHGDNAEVDVNYIAAGKIDALLRYSPPPKTPYMKTGMAYHLISMPPRDSADGSDGKTGSVEWKIDGPRGLPWTTVNGAIHYITGMRDKSKDSVLTRNADEALARLAKLN